jgi:hypothetical protein
MSIERWRQFEVLSRAVLVQTGREGQDHPIRLCGVASRSVGNEGGRRTSAPS